MERTWTLVCVLLPAAALAPAAPRLKDPPPKEAPLIGEWLRVGHTQSGAAVPPDGEPHHQVFGADGKWTYSYGSNVSPSGTYVADARQSPPAIDIRTDSTGQNGWRGIFKVEGDRLTLCLVKAGHERPKTFESTADLPTTVWVFKRVKPKD
jgi:uncharacterized protein (TIGR03067 family)